MYYIYLQNHVGRVKESSFL